MVIVIEQFGRGSTCRREFVISETISSDLSGSRGEPAAAQPGRVHDTQVHVHINIARGR